MQILKAFKFQLNTTKAQETAMRQFAGSCRFVWNKTLALQKELLADGESCLSYNKTAALLVDWKKDEKTDFLSGVHSQILQQTLMNLDKALREAFDKNNPKQFPRFKKRGLNDSFRYPQGFKLDEPNSRVFLPKIGWTRYRKSQNITGTPKNITVKRELDKWYVSVQTELETAEPVHPYSSIVGIDMGIVNLATLSDGTVIPPINSLNKNLYRLRKIQKRLSRKKKFSANWFKQKKKIQKAHRRVKNIRNDHLHKATTEISKNHAVIVIEDLKVSNMSASASGTKESPGKNIRAKSGLNRSILDRGWGEFRRQLEYKQKWRGGEVIAIPPPNTSRMCSVCGYTSSENRKSQEHFACVKCGYETNADLNAARNILAAGQAVSVCGGLGATIPA
jgi:putative transposase